MKGKLYYFGKVSTDPKGEVAIKDWLARKDNILAGRDDKTPARHPDDPVAIKDVCNAFYGHKKALREAGELAERSLLEYYATCKRLVKAFGRLRPVSDLVADDFRRLRHSRKALGTDTTRERNPASAIHLQVRL